MPCVRKRCGGVYYARPVSLLAAILSICSSEAADQNRLRSEQDPEFQITSWKTEQGLPQNRVECLLQTRDGYLWAGTGVGLARFDGVRFTTYNRSNTPEFQSEVCKALAEDGEGNLWIGTKSGLLVRKLGGFTRFTTKQGLCHDEISAICSSKDGGIWIGTGGGVSRYVNGTFTNYFNGLTSQRHVYSLCEDQAGELWVGFADGLFKLDANTGSFRHIWQTSGKLPHNNYDIVTRVYRDRRNRIWIGTYHGVYQISGEQISRYEIENRDENIEIRFISEDGAGTVHVLSERSFSRFDNDHFVSIPLPDSLQEDSLRSICKDREDNLWIGSTYGGLKRLSPKVLRTYSAKDGLIHNDVWSISQSKDGTVWVGSSGGVSRVKDGQITARKDITQFVNQSPTIRSIIEDRFGGLWLGTAFANTWHMQETNELWYRVGFEAGHNQCSVVFEDRSGTVWVGTRGGLTRAFPVPGPYEDRHQWLANTHDDYWIYKTNDVLRVSGTNHWQYRSDLWEFHPTNSVHHGNENDRLGPRLDGTHLKEASWTTNLIRGELSHPEVRAILEDRMGTLWFATAGGGLNRLRDGRFTALTTKDGLISDVTWALHEDPDGALWIATGRGLSRLKDGRFSNFGIEHGLFDNLINQILEDDFGNLWMGCKRGIFRVSRKALDDVAEGVASSVNCISLGEADGMLASETNGRVQPAGCKTKDGKLWFPTVHGVVVINPSQVRLNSVLPSVAIEEVRANDSIVFKDGRVLAGGRGSHGSSALVLDELPGDDSKPAIMFPPGSGSLVEIEYTALSLAAPEKVRFQYRLEGHSTAWRDAETRIARFTNLLPGHYRFHVTACNNHGIWNQAGASFGFYIAPYFYQTKWFFAACGLATVLFGYGIRGWMARRQCLVHDLKAQLSIEQERARIAQDIHDDLGAHLTHIGVLAELANRSLESQNRAAGHVQKIAAATDESSRSLDEIVWALNPENDSLRSLVAYLRTYVTEYLLPADIQCEFAAPAAIPSWVIAAQVRHHVFLIFKEALHNTVQHSGAGKVIVQIDFADSTVVLELRDNGRGFRCEEARQANRGNGLGNMETRAAAIGGSISIASQVGSGTAIRLRFRLDGK